MQKIFSRSLLGAMLILSLLVFAGNGHAENIDSTNKYAWSENTGWHNYNSTTSGVHVYSDHLEGYAWAENIGWVKMSAYTGGNPHTCANTSGTDWGVNNDGSGNLSGYAWSENTGWINFDSNHSQVIIDPATGDFSGYAWGENIGWISFSDTSPVAYKVKTSWTAPQTGASWTDSFSGSIPPDQNWAYVDTGDSSTYTVTNNRLELHTEGGPSMSKSINAYVDAVDATDAIISARVQQITAGDKYWAYVGLRGDAISKNIYSFGINDSGNASIGKGVNGTAIILISKDLSSIVTTPHDCMLKFAAIGHKLFGKAWNYGDSEPCEWQLETSDTDYGSGDSGVGLLASLAPTVQAAFDDIVVTTDLSNFYQAGACDGAQIAAGGSATVTSGGSSVTVNSSSGQTHVISVSEDSDTPVNPGRGLFAGNLINKHVEVSCSLDDGDFTAVVKLHYTDGEISGITEIDLRLYYYDTSSSSWRLAVEGNTTGGTSFKGDSASTSTLGDYGVDTANNIVWAVVDHFTSFGAGGTGTGGWVLQNTLLAANTYLMLQGDSSKAASTVAMANGDVDVWVSGAPATVLTTFTNPFGGQLQFNAVTTAGNYNLVLGSWTSGGGFVASGISGTVALGVGTTTYDMDALGTFGAGSFNVAAGSYLAMRITNSTGAAQTLLTGGLRSWLNGTNSSSAFPTLITLTSFTAEIVDTGVLLKWHTESEVENAGFNIWRGTEKDGAYTKITDTMIPATGSETVAADYEYTDDTAQDGVRYYYRLEDIDTSGASTMNGPVTLPGGGGDNNNNTCFIDTLLNR